MKPEGGELHLVSKNEPFNKPCGSKSFDSEDCESTSSEYRRNHVKSLPNLRGLVKKKKREETGNKNKLDIWFSVNEGKGSKNVICDEEHSGITVGQNMHMKICDSDNNVINKRQVEFQKSCNHRTSKISRSFPSVIRRNGPQKKHLLCKRFHGDASDEREGGDSSAKSLCGGQLRYKMESNFHKSPPQPLLQSSTNNHSETCPTGLKNGRTRNMLSRKYQKKQNLDTCNRQR